MTLSAITKNLLLFSPAVLLDRGRDRGAIAVQMRQLQSKGLFCPHCYRKSGEFVPIRFRNATDRKPHFFHLQALEGGTECRNFSGESEKHLAAKTAIAERLKAEQGLLNMEIDTRYLSAPDLVWRKPDILVTYQNGAIESHEVQISPIPSDAILERTADQKAHGVAQVVWYLYGGNFNRENRIACQKNAIPCYHLWFEERDDSRPRWRLGERVEFEPKPRSQSAERDTCSHVSAEVEAVPKQAVARPTVAQALSRRAQVAWWLAQVAIALSVEELRSVVGSFAVAHCRKPGWVGGVYEHPFGLKGVCCDVVWLFAPDRVMPLAVYPSRYDCRDLIFGQDAIASVALPMQEAA